MRESCEIIICGDLCPTTDTLEYFESQDSEGLFNDVLPVLKKAHFVLGNLEFVLTDNPRPAQKIGPILYGKSNYIRTLKSAGIQALSLANNHIKDCGQEGVSSTIQCCSENNIDFFGAGRNLKEAKSPYIKYLNGHRIGFVSFAEQEFNTATDSEYGASYLDPYEDYDYIKEIKHEVDYLVVLYHGGIEYYEYPSPLLQKRCRKFIDSGADIVTCQHSHCIGTLEHYAEGKIIYGQGNTLFGYRSGNNSWNHGLLLKLVFQPNLKKPQLELIPIHATPNGIMRFKESEARAILEGFFERSLKVTDKNFIETRWNEFCESRKPLYYSYLFGYSKPSLFLNRYVKNRLLMLLHTKRAILTSANVIRCEAHNEVMQTIIRNDKY